MDLPAEKEVCATCLDWQGKREWLADGSICRVSTTARGKCQKHAKIKPPQGGCADWKASHTVKQQD
ncbi:MAG: hypothetical protein ACUVRZ_11505 [Desulfobacca sp.]|uniref:hypothetical protein n=1 Tax=Desulfobacca sp. TaxID=2067990 RepID=UPI00404A788C